MSRVKPTAPPSSADRKVIRCAVYTRKSSEEGLAMEFNSLDAQREAAEAYVASQRAEGWVCLPERYDDGGFSGGSMDRPAHARLLADVAAGRVDCVVVYKVDRLSRSLLDFTRILETFDRHRVSFVSVTQQFNTTHSMGRLTLNILLSFAQFEREIIGERIRDKLAAQKRRGKWAGGAPVLGYDVDRSGPSPKLVVNAAEAARARAVFALYLEYGSLLPVVKELDRRGWRTKARLTKAGKPVGGTPFDKCNLHGMLTNPLYAGKVRHKAAEYDGEHEAIIDRETFGKVQALLKHNGRTGGVEARNRHGALLKRLLVCRGCGCAMTHTFTTARRGGRQYRYYACVRGLKRGRAACGGGSLPAAEVERVVVDQVRPVGRDPGVAADVVAAARRAADDALAALATERRELAAELGRHGAEVKRLAGVGGEQAAARLAELAERARAGERRQAELQADEERLGAERVGEADVRTALGAFDGAWGSLSPREQARLLALLVQRVEYDAAAGTVAVTFHPTGINALSKRQLEAA